jgi:short-subunit dehydrogenase
MTVLILGATSDIGFAIAKKFAAGKHNLQLAGRNIDQLKPLQSDLEIRYGVSCSVHSFDAMKFETHQSFYNSLSPKPTVSIYVIGYMNDNDKVINDWNESSKTIHSNFTGAVSILNIIAADYASKQNGTIVGISSVAGNRGRQSNYI